MQTSNVAQKVPQSSVSRGDNEIEHVAKDLSHYVTCRDFDINIMSTGQEQKIYFPQTMSTFLTCLLRFFFFKSQPALQLRSLFLY